MTPMRFVALICLSLFLSGCDRTASSTSTTNAGEKEPSGLQIWRDTDTEEILKTFEVDAICFRYEGGFVEAWPFFPDDPTHSASLREALEMQHKTANYARTELSSLTRKVDSKKKVVEDPKSTSDNTEEPLQSFERLSTGCVFLVRESPQNWKIRFLTKTNRILEDDGLSGRQKLRKEEASRIGSEMTKAKSTSSFGIGFSVKALEGQIEGKEGEKIVLQQQVKLLDPNNGTVTLATVESLTSDGKKQTIFELQCTQWQGDKKGKSK